MVINFNFLDQFPVNVEIKWYCQLIFQKQDSVFTAKGHRVPVYVRLKTAHCSFSVCLCVWTPPCRGPVYHRPPNYPLV